ncbi:MAG: cytochrome c-type biogenesis protein CcmF [Limisphaerales bacterium]|jgi:cytochrome c-type biogenesis protein CcmF
MEPTLQQMAMPDGQAINPEFGWFGHLFVVLAFSAALWSVLSYWLSTRESDPSSASKWHKIGRISFGIHAASILGIVITLFMMILGHHFEYYYVWHHSSTDLAFKYVLSCFWEGQEGSFLLWSFWHAVLGLILIKTAGKWEGRVMPVIGITQVALMSFLLGIYVFGTKIGTSPFLLLEDVLTRDPVFIYDDYMRFVRDGTGLNALLQNYWMVIHPPTLFLGFASTIVPFAYAWAGISSGQYKEWVKPALPWALFAMLVLGTGILMGGIWAYESLSFGGFWAWDPVENASLVPWLVLIGGVHTMVSNRSTGRALRTSVALILLSWFLIIFSSYLTRSGVLGDTSVHSFVDAGLNRQLLFWMFTFLIITIIQLFRKWRKIPVLEREEELSSREFWMFMGALVLLFSGLQISIVTSMPAINSFSAWINSWTGLGLREDWPYPANPEHYFNSIQIWVAIGLGFLMGTAQLFRYKSTKGAAVKKVWILCFAIAALLSVLMIEIAGFEYMVQAGNSKLPSPFVFLMLAGWFAVVANIYYIFGVLKGKFKVSGASVAHAGFGLMLIGILISNAKQEVISENKLGIDYGEQFDNDFKRDNILLYKNLPQTMGDYKVTYQGDSSAGDKTYFFVNYNKLNKEGKTVEDFTLTPHLIRDKKSNQQSPNPSTRHYLGKDIFTHVSGLPPQEPAKQNQPKVDLHTCGIGDTLIFSMGMVTVMGMELLPPAGDTIRAGLKLRIDAAGFTQEVVPEVRISNVMIGIPLNIPDARLQITIRNIIPEEDKFELVFIEQRDADDWIIMKAIIFPQINLVWFGALALFFGIGMSIARRIRLNKNSKA